MCPLVFNAFKEIRKVFGQGVQLDKLWLTLPTLCFESLSLAQQSAEDMDLRRSILQFVHEILTALRGHVKHGKGSPESSDSKLNLVRRMWLILQLFLAAGDCAIRVCSFDVISVEFFSQALRMLESIQIDDTLPNHEIWHKQAIMNVLGTLLSIPLARRKKLEIIQTGIVRHVHKYTVDLRDGKGMKPKGFVNTNKQCQVDLVLSISHCFFENESEKDQGFGDSQVVLECLQLALKLVTNGNISEKISPNTTDDKTEGSEPLTLHHIELLVQVLDKYAYYCCRFNDEGGVRRPEDRSKTHGYLVALVALIRENMASHYSSSSDSSLYGHIENHLQNTVKFIEASSRNGKLPPASGS